MGIRDWFRRTPVSEQATETDALESPRQVITAEEVFTPTSSAKRAFIGRGSTQDNIRTALRTPGTQLVVFGESGAGKSSVVEHVLEKLGRKNIATQCTAGSTYTEILASVFSELGTYVVSAKGTENHADLEIRGSVGSDLAQAKLETAATIGGVNNVTTTPYVGPQLTAQEAQKALAARKTTWIIEDLHKVDEDVRKQIADLLKVFANKASAEAKVVVIGASETATSIVNAPADVRKRVSQIAVKPLTTDELGEIIDTGATIMNVDMSAVRGQIIHLSAGVASVTHALGLRCLQLLDIETPVVGDPVSITNDTLVRAALSYAESMSGTMQEAFDKGMLLKRRRQYDNCALILKAIASLPERGGTKAEILDKIRETHPNYPQPNLNGFLPQLTEEDRGELLRETLDGRWRYSEPLQHTYAQILFEFPVGADDLFADALSSQVPAEQRREAQEAASEA